MLSKSEILAKVDDMPYPKPMDMESMLTFVKHLTLCDLMEVFEVEAAPKLRSVLNLWYNLQHPDPEWTWWGELSELTPDQLTCLDKLAKALSLEGKPSVIAEEVQAQDYQTEMAMMGVLRSSGKECSV